MPLVNATTVWQSATLASDEIWQARTFSHAVLVTAETPGGPEDMRGIRLTLGEVRIFRAGQTVSWRAEPGPQDAYTAQLHREIWL